MGHVINDWMRPGAQIARVELSPELLTSDGVLSWVSVANPIPEDAVIRRVATNSANGKTVVYIESSQFPPRRPNMPPPLFDPQVDVPMSGGAYWPFLSTVREWMEQDPNRGK